MRPGRGILLFLIIAAGCESVSNGGRPGPETLGAIPDDLPLPPGFGLDPKEKSWLGPADRGRSACIRLRGGFKPEYLRRFFLDHFRLARWKNVRSEGGAVPRLVFRKGEDEARITIRAEGTLTLVDVLLNCESMEKDR